MKFAQDSQNEGYIVTGYDEDSISIKGTKFNQSLIVTNTELNENWGVDSIETLHAGHIEQILSFEPELVLIGTGDKLIFPSIEVYSAIIEHGIGIDFMDTGAACRTYNILVDEGRGVVAGLIL